MMPQRGEGEHEKNLVGRALRLFTVVSNPEKHGGNQDNVHHIDPEKLGSSCKPGEALVAVIDCYEEPEAEQYGIDPLGSGRPVEAHV